jgi:hypothetical protein
MNITVFKYWDAGDNCFYYIAKNDHDRFRLCHISSCAAFREDQWQQISELAAAHGWQMRIESEETK